MVLQKLRDRLTGIMAIFILGLLAIPFAFVGVNSYLAPDSVNNLAIVNDESITLNEFNLSFQNQRERMRALMGASFDAAQFDQPIVRRQHLDNMIDQELLRQAAAETGLSVDDQFLAQTIRDIPDFQIDGVFDAEVYQSALSAQSETPQAFENRLRAQMVLGQFPSVISTSAIATSSEIDNYIRLQEQKRAFRAVVIPAQTGDDEQAKNEDADEGEDESETESDGEAADGDAAAQVSEEAVLAWYEAHPEDYRHPERVVVEYLELKASDLAEEKPVDEETLRQRFEEQKGRFVTPESRLASHILVTVDPTADDAEIETAREEAAALYERAIAGEDFAELAREHSEDQGSAADGGDLGWVEPGVMVQAFEDALYVLSLENPISEPVQTGFGWHVIQLGDIRPAEGMSFAEARETLEAEYIAERNERRFLEAEGRLIDIIYEDPTTLEAAAEELGLEIKTTGPFSRAGGEGIAANREFVDTAFSDLVLLQGSASDPVDIDSNHVAVVRLREHLPETPVPIEVVRDEIIAAVLRDEGMQRAESKAEDFLTMLDAGTSLQELATGAGLELIESEGATRNDSSLDAGLRQKIFDIGRPPEGEASRAVLRLDDGFAVAELLEVIDGALSEEEAARRDNYRRRLANVTASGEAIGFLRMLRAQSEVTVFEDRL